MEGVETDIDRVMVGDREVHLGVFHTPRTGAPDGGRSAAPAFGTDGGVSYMFYEAGHRLSIVAPKHEQSWIGAAKSRNRPVHVVRPVPRARGAARAQGQEAPQDLTVRGCGQEGGFGWERMSA